MNHDGFGRRALLAGAAACAALPALGATKDAVIEAARKEEGLVWYDHYDRDAVEALFAAFRKAYPFVRRTEFVDVPSAQKTAKIIQESNAGGPTSDILLNDPAVLQQLVDRNMVLQSDWASLGVPPGPVTMPTPYMVLATTATYVTLVNTDQVKPEVYPQSWKDATDARWQGRTGHWLRAAAFVQLVPTIGEPATRALVMRLAALRPRMFDGLFPLAQAVGSGELALAVTAYDSSVRVVESGAPVKMLPLDLTPVNLLCGGALRYGKNPNTAQLFLAWLTTEDGAMAFERATRRGNYFVKGTETAKLLQGRKLSFYEPVDSVKQAPKLNALEAEYSRMLQGR